MANIAERVFTLINETVEQQGVFLWDVRFVKEGASYYLRVFIDKEEGISIDDCTNVSHAIDPLLDEADPIEQSYYLEVCSPGIERELSREFHFEMAVGCNIKLRLFKTLDGKKEFEGVLNSFENGELTLAVGETELKIPRTSVSKATLAEKF